MVNVEKSSQTQHQAEPTHTNDQTKLFNTLVIGTGVVLLVFLAAILWVFCHLGPHDSPPPLQFLVTTLLSLFVLAAIALQVIIYWRMSAQNERIISATEQAFQVGEAAHFGVTQIRWINAEHPTNPTLLEVTFLNGGKSPAWQFHPFVILAKGQSVEDSGGIAMKLMPTNMRHRFIPPGEERAFVFAAEALPTLADLYEDFRQSSDQLFVWIEASYWDFRRQQRKIYFTAKGGRRQREEFEDLTASEMLAAQAKEELARRLRQAQEKESEEH